MRAVATTSAASKLVPVVRRPPTDFGLLQAIHKRHRDEYANFPEGSRATKNAVPIDIPAIAGELGIDPNSVFGRLYHHLDPLYSTYSPDGKSRKGLFIAQPGTAKDLIVFPVLEAALAGLRQQRRRDLWTRSVAVISLVIAIVSLIVTVINAT
jgi:hypothetical protein